MATAPADERDEWRAALVCLTDAERAEYDDPRTYADLHGTAVIA